MRYGSQLRSGISKLVKKVADVGVPTVVVMYELQSIVPEVE